MPAIAKKATMDPKLVGNELLPLGFRHPTDKELIGYYLKMKVKGIRSIYLDKISEVDVYKHDPEDLGDKSCLKTKDLKWYFFCPRAKKFRSGARTNRTTKAGYWKQTGTDRTVHGQNYALGKIKTLVFHRGKAPNGTRTDWVMHEYRLDDKVLAETKVVQDFVISKIFKKSGVGPKKREQHCAPFIQEEWKSDADDEHVNGETYRGVNDNQARHSTVELGLPVAEVEEVEWDEKEVERLLEVELLLEDFSEEPETLEFNPQAALEDLDGVEEADDFDIEDFDQIPFQWVEAYELN